MEELQAALLEAIAQLEKDPKRVQAFLRKKEIAFITD
jgi:hypothetical protein